MWGPPLRRAVGHRAAAVSRGARADRGANFCHTASAGRGNAAGGAARAAAGRAGGGSAEGAFWDVVRAGTAAGDIFGRVPGEGGGRVRAAGRNGAATAVGGDLTVGSGGSSASVTIGDLRKESRFTGGRAIAGRSSGGQAAGETAGGTASAAAGEAASAAAGVAAGEAAGVAAGEAAGVAAGEAAGVAAGVAAGEAAGVAAGEAAGVAAGEAAGAAGFFLGATGFASAVAACRAVSAFGGVGVTAAWRAGSAFGGAGVNGSGARCFAAGGFDWRCVPPPGAPPPSALAPVPADDPRLLTVPRPPRDVARALRGALAAGEPAAVERAVEKVLAVLPAASGEDVASVLEAVAAGGGGGANSEAGSASPREIAAGFADGASAAGSADGASAAGSADAAECDSTFPGSADRAVAASGAHPPVPSLGAGTLGGAAGAGEGSVGAAGVGAAGVGGAGVGGAGARFAAASPAAASSALTRLISACQSFCVTRASSLTPPAFVRILSALSQLRAVTAGFALHVKKDGLLLLPAMGPGELLGFLRSLDRLGLYNRELIDGIVERLTDEAPALSAAEAAAALTAFADMGLARAFATRRLATLLFAHAENVPLEPLRAAAVALARLRHVDWDDFRAVLRRALRAAGDLGEPPFELAFAATLLAPPAKDPLTADPRYRQLVRRCLRPAAPATAVRGSLSRLIGAYCAAYWGMKDMYCDVGPALRQVYASGCSFGVVATRLIHELAAECAAAPALGPLPPPEVARSFLTAEKRGALAWTESAPLRELSRVLQEMPLPLRVKWERSATTVDAAAGVVPPALNYYVQFICREHRLVLELDSPQSPTNLVLKHRQLAAPAGGGFRCVRLEYWKWRGMHKHQEQSAHLVALLTPFLDAARSAAGTKVGQAARPRARHATAVGTHCANAALP